LMLSHREQELLIGFDAQPWGGRAVRAGGAPPAVRAARRARRAPCAPRAPHAARTARRARAPANCTNSGSGHPLIEKLMSPGTPLQISNSTPLNLMVCCCAPERPGHTSAPAGPTPPAGPCVWRLHGYGSPISARWRVCYPGLSLG
jgi:hypothetical protein